MAFEWGFANRQLRGRGQFTYKEPVSTQTTHVCSWNHKKKHYVWTYRLNSNHKED